MAGDLLLAEHFGQVRGDALGQLAGIHEDQRRAMTVDKPRDLPVDLMPLLVRTDRRKRRGWYDDCHVHLATVSDVHQRAIPPHAHEKSGDLFQRLLRGGQADALNRARQCFQALQRERQMRAAFVAGKRVNFIDNCRPDASQHFASAGAGQQDVERLGGGDEDVRRFAQHCRAIALRRIAGTNQDADLREVRIKLRQFVQRTLQVLLNVIAQCPQRRDVEHRCLIGKRGSLTGEAIDRGEVSRQGFAHAGGGGNQGVGAGADFRPPLPLRLGGFAKALLEPALDGGMKTGKWHRGDYTSGVKWFLQLCVCRQRICPRGIRERL